jgi:prepilin-type N-terminal cleavage/methylation domain-containing protein
MKNKNIWLKTLLQFEQEKENLKRDCLGENAGFTMIELLVVIVLAGVIAAIAAPGWISFVSQRRANAVNDYIFRSLQEAQSQAKNKKVSYSVSVRVENGVPEVAVYPTKTSDISNYWKSLDRELAIKGNQILLGTNLNGENSATASSSYPPPNNSSSSPSNSPVQKITFDYMGALQTGVSGAPPSVNPPLTIVTAVPAGNSNNPIVSTKRCVQVTTILGSISIGRGQYDATSNPGGCP